MFTNLAAPSRVLARVKLYYLFIYLLCNFFFFLIAKWDSATPKHIRLPEYVYITLPFFLGEYTPRDVFKKKKFANYLRHLGVVQRNERSRNSIFFFLIICYHQCAIRLNSVLVTIVLIMRYTFFCCIVFFSLSLICQVDTYFAASFAS